MSLPIILPSGFVLVYGWGNPSGVSGIKPTNNEFVFGNVYQIWDGGATFIYGGDPVMWRGGKPNDPSDLGDAYCKLTYSGNPYTIIPARLVTKETFIP